MPQPLCPWVCFAACSTERHPTRCLSAHPKRTTRPGLPTDDLPPAPRNLAPRTCPRRFTRSSHAAPPYRYPLACLALLLLHAAPRLQACIDRRRTGSPETERQHTTDTRAGPRLACTRCTARLLHCTATHERLSRRPTAAALPRCLLVVLAAATLSRCGAQDADTDIHKK